MKRYLLILLVLTICHLTARGQWYYRHYKVDDPMVLTQEQFSMSIKKVSTYTVIGGVFSAVGAGFIISAAMVDVTTDDFETSFWNGLERTGKLVVGGAIIATGVTLILVSSETISKIKIARSMAFPDGSSLNITPSLLDGIDKSIIPGITLSVSF